MSFISGNASPNRTLDQSADWSQAVHVDFIPGFLKEVLRVQREFGTLGLHISSDREIHIVQVGEFDGGLRCGKRVLQVQQHGIAPSLVEESADSC